MPKDKALDTPWRSIADSLPRCPRKPDSLGTPVIVYVEDGFSVGGEYRRVFEAYYGRRITALPSFYLHGVVLHDVTHWLPMPKAPK